MNPKLVIFDLNNTWIKETPDIKEASFTSRGVHYVKRANIEAFLNELAERGCQIAVWSSATYPKVKALASEVYDDLAFIWDRGMCSIDPDSEISHATVKKIDRIFESPIVNQKRIWNSTNVVIVDDSESKLRFNPPCTRIVLDFDEDIYSILDIPFFS